MSPRGLMALAPAVLSAVCMAAGSCRAAAADQRGLATSFVEVQLEGVPIAARYVLDLKPIDIVNKSTYTMRMHCEALVPRPDELRGGYDPVPDPAWIQFEPKDFTISAGGRATSRLVIATPDDPALTGRKYEASIYVRGVPVESPAVGVGLKPRLYFSLAGHDRPDLVVRMNTAPTFPRMTPFEPGTGTGTMRFIAGNFTAQNQTADPVVYETAPDAGSIARSGDGGATLLPDLGWVTLNPRTLVLAPWTSALIGVEVNLPIQASLFGKAYVIPIHTIVRHPGGAAVDLYNRVLIAVPDPGGTSATGSR